MPKLNYGYKGDALTAAQAIALGATITSQDFAYQVQLGAVTPLLPPGPPGTPTATAGNQQVSLSWSAPSATNGASVTGYVISYTSSAGGGTASSSGTSVTITGLTNGIVYTFSVAAVTSNGTGDYGGSASATPVGGPVFTSVSFPTSGGQKTFNDSAVSLGATTTGVGTNELTFTLSSGALSGSSYPGYYNPSGITVSADGMLMFLAATSAYTGNTLNSTVGTRIVGWTLQKDGSVRLSWGRGANSFGQSGVSQIASIKAGSYTTSGLSVSTGTGGPFPDAPVRLKLIATGTPAITVDDYAWQYSGGWNYSSYMRLTDVSHNYFTMSKPSSSGGFYVTFTPRTTGTVTITRDFNFTGTIVSQQLIAGGVLSKGGIYTLTTPSSGTITVSLTAGVGVTLNIPATGAGTFTIAIS